MYAYRHVNQQLVGIASWNQVLVVIYEDMLKGTSQKCVPFTSFIFCIWVETLNFLLHTPDGGEGESQLAGKFRFIGLHSLASAGGHNWYLHLSYIYKAFKSQQY